MAGLAALRYLRNNSNELIVIESQPVFMSLVAVGCIILGASIIPLTFENSAGCMTFVWLFSFGITLVLSSLSAKSIRVAVLWYGRGLVKQRNKAVRAAVLLRWIMFIMVTQLAIIISWQVVAPLIFQESVELTDSFGNPLYTSTSCATSNQACSIFLYVLIIFVCVVVLATGLVSFWVRNAPEKYQDAKWTAVSAVCIFQLFFIALPATTAVWGSSLPRFLVMSSTTFLLCLIILMTMFLPKALHAEFRVNSHGNSHASLDRVSGQPRDLPEGSPSNEEISERKHVRSQINAVRSDKDLLVNGFQQAVAKTDDERITLI